jgi:hypothetical protein
MRESHRNRFFKVKLVVLALATIFLLILSACAGAPVAEEPAAPAPEEPVEPIEPSEFPVQYGQDSRTELLQHSDSKLKDMAASVAIFVHSQQVTTSGDMVSLNGYTLNEMGEMGWLVEGANAPMCSGELYTSQPAPGFCTGFLVEDNILVTAGHCLQKAPCSDTSIVFGFYMNSSNGLSTITTADLFKCAEVIAQETPTQENDYIDYAIIKLDRSTGRTGLEFTTDDYIEIQMNVAVLGHPSGLPMKIASDAFVISNDSSEPFFVTNLDTFGSNSGSPVINTATYLVDGILVRGANDYILSDDGSCIQVNRCPEGGGGNCTGENATKMALLSEFIPENSDISWWESVKKLFGEE